MASAFSSDIFYIISDELPFSHDEPGDGWTSSSQAQSDPEFSGIIDEGQVRWAPWHYARITSRNSTKGNC